MVNSLRCGDEMVPTKLTTCSPIHISQCVCDIVSNLSSSTIIVHLLTTT